MAVTQLGSRLKVEWDALEGQEITGYLVSAINEQGTIEEGASSIFVPYKEGRQHYETFIEGWTSDREYNVVVQAFLEEKLPGEQEEEIQGWPFVNELLGSGQYEVKWAQEEDVYAYKIVLIDEFDEVAQTFLYEVPEGIPQDQELSVVVRGLPTKKRYSARIYPVRNEDLFAKNVSVSDIGDGSSKTVGFDSIQRSDLKSYMIVAIPGMIPARIRIWYCMSTKQEKGSLQGMNSPYPGLTLNALMMYRWLQSKILLKLQRFTMANILNQ